MTQGGFQSLGCPRQAARRLLQRRHLTLTARSPQLCAHPGGPQSWSLDWTPGHNGLQLDTPFLVFAPDTSEMHRGPSLPARKTIQSRVCESGHRLCPLGSAPGRMTLLAEGSYHEGPQDRRVTRPSKLCGPPLCSCAPGHLARRRPRSVRSGRTRPSEAVSGGASHSPVDITALGAGTQGPLPLPGSRQATGSRAACQSVPRRRAGREAGGGAAEGPWWLP